MYLAIVKRFKKAFTARFRLRSASYDPTSRLRRKDHRDPNSNKRDENLVPVQVSLKDIWEALMEKISSFIFA